MALKHMYMYSLDSLDFAVEYLTFQRSNCPSYEYACIIHVKLKCTSESFIVSFCSTQNKNMSYFYEWYCNIEIG